MLGYKTPLVSGIMLHLDTRQFSSQRCLSGGSDGTLQTGEALRRGGRNGMVSWQMWGGEAEEEEVKEQE